MREFILRTSKARTSPNIRFDDLPGEGKLDVVCHCISNAMHVSHHVRTDTIFHVVMDGPPVPPKVITFDGSKIKELGLDERSIAGNISVALKKGFDLKLGEEANVDNGITIAKKSFESLLREKAEGRKVFYLDKKGKDIREIDLGNSPLFVLGDQVGMPKNTERLLARLNSEKIKLGPVMLFAAQCIPIVHNEIDRKIFGKKD